MFRVATIIMYKEKQSNINGYKENVMTNLVPMVHKQMDGLWQNIQNDTKFDPAPRLKFLEFFFSFS